MRMAQQQAKTVVEGLDEREQTEERRTRRFFFFFKTEWWEKVSEKHLGNDLYITTERDIHQVYLNGIPLIK